jgi:spore coat polysaccharide biosynthesis protein SpsF (cytidylyltransferase family)
MRNAILIQARYSSKRLPGKVIKKLSKKEILLHVYENCKKSKIKKIIILTSRNKSDDVVVDFCKKNKIKYFRGSLKNVYLRYVSAIKKLNIDNFIRITGDSPMINYKLINTVFNKFNKKNYDIVTNVFPRSFPIGQSVEMINGNTFTKNYKNIRLDEKEHITKYFYNNFKKFKIINIKSNKNYSKKNLSINTYNDYYKIKRIIENEKI